MVDAKPNSRPLPGDLDGDQYFVSWNEAIIPETVDPANPRQASRPGTPFETEVKVKLKVKKPMMQDHMGELKRYLAMRVLSFDIGMTAKSWDETANARELGSRDPYCLALSDRYEVCLDTNKTGDQIPPMPHNSLKGPLRTGMSIFSKGNPEEIQDVIANAENRPVPFRPTGLDYLSGDDGLVQTVDLWQRGLDFGRATHSLPNRSRSDHDASSSRVEKSVCRGHSFGGEILERIFQTSEGVGRSEQTVGTRRQGGRRHRQKRT